MWVKYLWDGCAEEEKKKKAETKVDGSIKHDLTEKGLSGEEVQDLAAWRHPV